MIPAGKQTGEYLQLSGVDELATCLTMFFLDPASVLRNPYRDKSEVRKSNTTFFRRDTTHQVDRERRDENEMVAGYIVSSVFWCLL